MNMPSEPGLRSVSLDDKYTLSQGSAFLSGTQALVRLPLMQQARDALAGHKTAALVTGYRGSPLGAYDQALQKAKAQLDQHHVQFLPAVNEDLAATALWGTQQTNLFEGARYDGVFGIWYGKNPGVDRCGDVFRHANQAGCSTLGGVLALAGDDVGAKSSTIAAQTDFIFSAVSMPVLAPATIQDYLDLGLHGIAMSRFASVWVGFRCVTDSVETSSVVDVSLDRITIKLPEFEMPAQGLSIRWPEESFLKLEERLLRYKLPAAIAYARANRLDRAVYPNQNARIGIISTGKAFLDVIQALSDLGIDEQTARALGIAVYKVAMPWPLDVQSALEFAAGLDQIIVVEEKRSLIEYQLKEALYQLHVAGGLNAAKAAISVVGKRDDQGREFIPEYGELSPALLAPLLVRYLSALSGTDQQRFESRLSQIARAVKGSGKVFETIQRIPYFCSGCPHNTSTRVPEGSRALAGIGCHYMSLWMDRNTATFTHMGGEGAQWVGQAPFTNTEHVFQNLGDGTYFHSGALAIRQAVAANTRITYKILFNDAVAMTGGQMHDGQLTPMSIAAQVKAEGVGKVVVVTDEPDKYPAGAFANDVSVFHRSRLDEVQRELREFKNVSVLIYDQTCASEKRRRRKRGTFPDPAKRAFINTDVCEGCGDCGTKSNCVSIEPIETELGRKRKINQSSCNKDFSCVEGFCPSFVTVHGGQLAKGQAQSAVQATQPKVNLPEPPSFANDRMLTNGQFSLMITGVGGTGVVTLGQLLGMAAHLQGLQSSVLDMAGLAQKGGAVWSFLRFTPEPAQLGASRIQTAGADALIGADLVVSAGRDTLIKLKSNAAVAVNASELPTADFTRNPDLKFPGGSMQAAIADVVGAQNAHFVDATRIATLLMGDAIATNMFMMGFAFQKGLIPLKVAAIVKAIELNAVAIKSSVASFEWGRRAAIDLNAVIASLSTDDQARIKNTAPVQGSTAAMQNTRQAMSELIARRKAALVQYQNQAYALRYEALVSAVMSAEQTLVGLDALPLTRAVADNFYKLMAYKDEYEVARLYASDSFQNKLKAQFEGDYRLEFHLAPPLFSKRNAKGELIKQSFGPWMMPVFGLLARFKWLRQTSIDPFGKTQERRREKQWINEYELAIQKWLLSDGIIKQDVSRLGLLRELAQVPESIRGFGHVKEIADLKAKQRWQNVQDQLSGVREVIRIKPVA
jgi:indolepyruvate ferredoxin oxidoreductase